ncbi:MAG: hypothetical protein J6W60_01845 [Treponema sp.]|nr:hypothetical protein [Treponema sp.]
MKKIILMTMIGVLATACITADGGIDFSGTVESTWGVAAPWTDSDTAGRFTLGTTSFTGELEAFYGNSSAYAQADFSYDATGALNGEGGSGNIGNGFNLSLGELWIDYTESFWGIRIGRQKAAWGKADGVDITNVLCPSNMSSFYAMIGDDSKLAVDALRVSLSGDSFTADAWWIPFFTPASLPLDEGNSLRKFVVPSVVEFPAGPGVVIPLPVEIAGLETPSRAIWNGEYGLKLSGYFSAFDVSLYGFYGWDDMPLLDYSLVDANSDYTPDGNVIGGEYRHMGMVGVDAALPIEAIVQRTETAFFPVRSFQKSAEKIITEKMYSSDVDSFETHNEISGLVGIDWMPSGWTLTAQYFCDFVFGSMENLEREDSYTHGMTVSVSKSLVNETLELSLAGLLNFNDLDSMISPSVTYSLSDQISIGGGAYIFLPGPENDGKYGAYKDLSSFYLNAKFSF